MSVCGNAEARLGFEQSEVGLPCTPEAGRGSKAEMRMADPQESRFSIQARLRTNLSKARNRYQQVKRRFDIGVESARSIGPNQPDGTHSLLNVTEEYNYRQAEYRKAIDQFCDFIIRGKSPAEGD